MKVPDSLALDFGEHRQPLVVCDGRGVDSTGVLVGLHQRGLRPDLILFADVGAERDATYAYFPTISRWLEKVGFPPITTVRYEPKDFKHWPPYHTIEENCLTNITLPSIAYGRHSCSSKWKISAQNKFLKSWIPALECWARGQKVRKAIGFEDSPRERRRSERGCATFAIQDDERDKFDLWFPLQDWGWDRGRCETEIVQAGLPVPVKSSCYFCTAMKPREIDDLALAEPDKLRRIVVIEARTRERHMKSAEARGWPRGVGVPLIEGLWRRSIKGMHGATPRPGSMTEYIRLKQLLPGREIDALIEATPTCHFSAEDFAKMGILNWQDWFGRVFAKARAAVKKAA